MQESLYRIQFTRVIDATTNFEHNNYSISESCGQALVIYILSASHSHSLSLQRQNTGPVRKLAVVTTGARRTSLVQQLQVARVNREGLIWVITPQITVTDIVRPRRATVCFTRERVLLRRCLGRPVATQTCRGEGPEVSSVVANRLDNHEVLLLALERVHLHRFEQVVGAIAHHGNVVGSKTTREVADRHAGSVDLAVVAAEEQVHVGRVGNQRLVDWTSAGSGDAAGKKCLRRGPRVAVRGVL
jgi:hypothetical protein